METCHARHPTGNRQLSTDLGYTGQRNYSYINLLDYGARWYSSSLGCFTQPDTIVPELTNPQAWNRFSYVNNNPIKYNDPTGHLLEESGIYPDEVGGFDMYRMTEQWALERMARERMENLQNSYFDRMIARIERNAEEAGRIITIVDGPGNRTPIAGGDILEVGTFDAERVKYGDASFYFIAGRGVGFSNSSSTVTVTFNPHFAVTARYQVMLQNSGNSSHGYGVYGAYEGTNGNSLNHEPSTSAEFGAYSYTTSVESSGDVTVSTTIRDGFYVSTRHPEELVLGASVFGAVLHAAPFAIPLASPTLKRVL